VHNEIRLQMKIGEFFYSISKYTFIRIFFTKLNVLLTHYCNLAVYLMKSQYASLFYTRGFINTLSVEFSNFYSLSIKIPDAVKIVCGRARSRFLLTGVPRDALISLIPLSRFPQARETGYLVFRR
jgi:hypothetical protein